MRISRVFILAGLAVLLIAVPTLLAEGNQPPAGWWKGNTHTHTWWSDGDSPPETAADWYKSRGYNFLVISDHNVLAEGEKWFPVRNDAQKQALLAYREKFGKDWVIERQGAETVEVRLKTLQECRPRFEETNRFLLIPGEEISERFQKFPVHLNGINLQKVIKRQGGKSVFEVMQRNVDAVLEQSRLTGQPMLVHLNHPNFGWGVVAEDIMKLNGERFFEIHNGHPGVRNYGDELHASTERMWDIVLAKRLGELKMEVMYGIASDDAHAYTAWGVGKANPGRGWVVVRAAKLTAAAIIDAMNQGDFYCSTGVILKDVRRDSGELVVEVQAEPGVNYTIRFIGTKKGFDPRGRKQPEDPQAYLTLKYSDEIGQVWNEVKGSSASYRLKPDDLYVRAKIASDKPHPNPFAQGDTEAAWTQPLIAGKSVTN